MLWKKHKQALRVKYMHFNELLNITITEVVSAIFTTVQLVVPRTVWNFSAFSHLFYLWFQKRYLNDKWSKTKG